MGPRRFRFERWKRYSHVRITLALLGSIGSIRCSVRSVLGVHVIEYIPDRHYRNHWTCSRRLDSRRSRHPLRAGGGRKEASALGEVVVRPGGLERGLGRWAPLEIS
eukprot:6520631-Alexandrium_andersonii.AAC.1